MKERIFLISAVIFVLLIIYIPKVRSQIKDEDRFKIFLLEPEILIRKFPDKELHFAFAFDGPNERMRNEFIVGRYQKTLKNKNHNIIGTIQYIKDRKTIRIYLNQDGKKEKKNIKEAFNKYIKAFPQYFTKIEGIESEISKNSFFDYLPLILIIPFMLREFYVRPEIGIDDYVRHFMERKYLLVFFFIIFIFFGLIYKSNH